MEHRVELSSIYITTQWNFLSLLFFFFLESSGAPPRGSGHYTAIALPPGEDQKHRARTERAQAAEDGACRPNFASSLTRRISSQKVLSQSQLPDAETLVIIKSKSKSSSRDGKGGCFLSLPEPDLLPTMRETGSRRESTYPVFFLFSSILPSRSRKLGLQACSPASPSRNPRTPWPFSMH